MPFWLIYFERAGAAVIAIPLDTLIPISICASQLGETGIVASISHGAQERICAFAFAVGASIHTAGERCL